MKKGYSFLSLIAFFAGIAAGLLIPDFCRSISFIGTVYINLLKQMIVPVLFAGIAAALSRDSVNVQKITVKTVLVFIVMFIASFLICSLLWAVLKPGAGASFPEVAWEGEIKEITLGNFFVSVFPSNIFAAMAENSILPVIIAAFAVGLTIRKLKLSILTEGVQELNLCFNKILSFVMLLTPFGVFALISNTVADYGSRILGTAALYIGCAYLGCVVITFFVMMLPVWIFCGIGPMKYLRKVYKIFMITLTTCSSAAALPNTIRVCNEEFGIPESITNLVVPLGCTIHMCGGAVSFSLLAMFNLQLFGMHPGAGTFLLMLLLALVINMGAPGIPGGGIVIGATYLATLGIPLGFIGFYAGIYRVLDMAYTTMNVCGDITANNLIYRMVNK